MAESDQAAETVGCAQCGASNPRSNNYCERCGAVLKDQIGSRTVEPVDNDAKRRAVAETVAISPSQLKGLGTARLSGSGHVVGFATDIGRSHHINQDAGGGWVTRRSDGTAASLVVVADGVSAGRHSERASQLAVDIVRDRLLPSLEDLAHDGEALLNELLETARLASREVAQRPHHSLYSADATTLVAAFCLGRTGGGVWCGDSRVYQVTARSITRLTRDHSWAEGMVSHGIMSAEDAARDPRAHMITRWLGPPADEDPGVETFRFDLEPGEIVLCCTDGLYMYFAPPVSDEGEMAQILAEHSGNLQAGIERLVQIALDRGGRDNITVGALSLELEAQGS